MEMLIELGISRSNQTLLNCTAWKQTDAKCCRSEKRVNSDDSIWYSKTEKKIQWKETVHYDKLFEILYLFYDMFACFLEFYYNSKGWYNGKYCLKII